MNKKVMALAVASALTVPGVALAQVTVSGGLRIGIYQQNIGGIVAGGPRNLGGAGTPTANDKEFRVSDNVTQLIFSAKEDLGGGLSVLGRIEMRPPIDGGGPGGGAQPSTTGCATNYVGLQSASWGQVLVGCVTAYGGSGGTGGSYVSARALAFTGNSSIMQRIPSGAALTDVGAGASSGTQLLNFGAGRTQNSITWNSPSWNGFGIDAQFSSNSTAGDGDLATPPAGATAAARKGSAFLIGPKYKSGGFSAQYIHYNQKLDGIAAVGGLAAVRDLKSNKIWATYNFSNGFSVTGVWSKHTMDNVYSGTTATKALNSTGGNRLADQTKWELGAQYATGPHTFAVDYSKANSDKVAAAGAGVAGVVAGTIGQTGATQWAMSWMYAFSKRTEVGLSYSKWNNDRFSAHGFADAGAFSLGGAGSTGNNGEDPSLFGFNMTHKF